MKINSIARIGNSLTILSPSGDGIPIREDRELVQVIGSLDVYREIPPELYKAAAEILVFLYTLNQGAIQAPPNEAHPNG